MTDFKPLPKGVSFSKRNARKLSRWSKAVRSNYFCPKCGTLLTPKEKEEEECFKCGEEFQL